MVRLQLLFLSNLKKSGTGFLFDGLFIARSGKVINSGSNIGSSVIVANGQYVDLINVMQVGDGGLVKSSKDVGTDLNNGIEWKEGVVHKLVKGATLNIPGGLTDCWGTSTYYGLSASEGVQVLHLTNSNKTWR
ncbi:hypothetical protein [Acinetobacter nosocomialis]|uniref:hypothetical protein n=1 Tax=Acinetobacter nosocomialis TaxID=106654 RepID=UPI0002CF19DE|nr:hypothetical protein [Acinetobacter nosocomialis]ENU48058.1 hypothetical protein F984_00336 [Acinetobacter nosocomialis NIPH 2119]MBR7734417.1 hypothetical protein [Acinetobacter nosocomialis]MDQ9029153.1 hypothetical protein [Acinetobacter nosocomialis]MDQ9046427.1 hypothetical protein [Acinetobacter nosocomialis]MDQ9083841.1 hypothetical protein [Acinetobacter nosocomialis]